MINKLHYDVYKIGNQSDRALVAIHGWQGNRNSLRPLRNSLKIKNLDWYFIEAPYSVEENKGKSWSYEVSEGIWEEDEPKYLLNSFFDELFNKYHSEKIYVLGFSQGGLVCLDFVLFLDKPLGGIFSISGFIREPEANIKRFHACQMHTPVLISHGKNDDCVPVSASKNVYKLLKNQGANVQLLLYEGGHKISINCLRKIKEIIQS